MRHEELAIVTGGASGVGAHAVSGLLAQGIQVIAVDRAWPAEAPADGLQLVGGDVTSEATWQEVARAIDAAGNQGVSMLVINAAHLAVGTVLDLEESEIRNVFEVNVMGAVKALKTCLPSMVQRGRGSVVAVASTDALMAEQGLAAYCASKGALLQLMRCIAVDHGRQGIRANTVCPGAIDTPFFRKHVDAAPDPEAFLEEKIRRHPAGRILQPEDVASAILYLLSEAAVGINGSHLVIDGGLTASFDFHADPA